MNKPADRALQLAARWNWPGASSRMNSETIDGTGKAKANEMEIVSEIPLN
jgi:hypothetical protein